nr:sucrose-phosphate phosphatase [Petrachloros mirabilis]
MVTDLDNTLVGDDAALHELNQQLTQHRQAHETRLVYSTGRSRQSYEQLQRQKALLEPDALVTAVGTEVYFPGQETPDPHWSAQLQTHWDRAFVQSIAQQFPELIPQPESEQRPFKVSFFLAAEMAPQVLPALAATLQAQQLPVKLVYSGGKDLDVLPQAGDKGQAMQFVRQTLGIAATQTLACGDSGNDIALFSAGEERGLIVGNAQPELRQWHTTNPSDRHHLAQAHYAAGILEGLYHFQFLS